MVNDSGSNGYIYIERERGGWSMVRWTPVSGPLAAESGVRLSGFGRNLDSGVQFPDSEIRWHQVSGSRVPLRLYCVLGLRGEGLGFRL